MGELISFVSHPYEHYVGRSLSLRVPRHGGRASRGVNVHDFRWVTSDEFDQYPFTPADEASMNKLLGLP